MPPLDDSLSAQKAALRRAQRSLLRACTGALFEQAGAGLVASGADFFAQLPPHSAVALYAATEKEVPLQAVHRALIHAGHTPCYPRVDPASGSMVFVPSAQLPTTPGAYGILEPEGEALGLDAIDAVCVPGLAFDTSGRRLGQGGGYYDRWIQARCLVARAPLLVGVCTARHLVERVPVAPHDRPMDALWTPQGVTWCRATGRKGS